MNLKDEHLPWLDGVRGLAALWVLLHHTHILVGAPGAPILSWGALAVDLFMMVSGFLMAHHFIERRERRPWTEAATWLEFWKRRWFRLSPVYYLLLATAFLLAGTVGEARAFLGHVWPATTTAGERYGDTSLLNYLLHASYVFGAVPQYAFRTVLPDWSIGLEAQFYLVFPFVMLLMAKLGPIRGGVMLWCVQGLAWLMLAGYMSAFPMPSFILLKLHIFIVGIWLAFSPRGRAGWGYLALAVAACLPYFLVERGLQPVARMLLVAGLFWLRNGNGEARRLAAAALSTRLMRFLGDASYSVYLVHLLLLTPIAAALAHSTAFIALPWAARFAACALIVAPPTYAVAALLFRFVETPGIELGKRIAVRPAARQGT